MNRGVPKDGKALTITRPGGGAAAGGPGDRLKRVIE
jgi:hypothetical protein